MTINDIVADYEARHLPSGPVAPAFPKGLHVIIDGTLLGEVVACYEQEILVSLSSGLTTLVGKSRLEVLA